MAASVDPAHPAGELFLTDEDRPAFHNLALYGREQEAAIRGRERHCTVALLASRLNQQSIGTELGGFLLESHDGVVNLALVGPTAIRPR